MTDSAKERVQEHHRAAAEMWSRGGRFYDDVSYAISDALAHAAQRLNPRPGERILDVGTGTGWTARNVARSDGKLDLPRLRVTDHVPRHLRHDGGDPCLILRIEAENRGDLPRSLTSGNQIMVLGEGDRRDSDRHPRPFATTIVASSVPRQKSR